MPDIDLNAPRYSQIQITLIAHKLFHVPGIAAALTGPDGIAPVKENFPEYPTPENIAEWVEKLGDYLNKVFPTDPNAPETP